MNALAWMLAAAALLLEPQSMPGLRTGPPNPLTGEVPGNYRHADVDGDGHADLVMPELVWRQVDGRFSAAGRTPYPEFAEPPRLDVWEGQLYLRFGDRLIILRWADGAWQDVHSQGLPWPPADAHAGPGTPGRAYLLLDRFLHDLDGDGRPELLAPSARGLQIYRWDDEQGGYRAAALLDILSRPRVKAPPAQTLWPPEQRVLRLPTRQALYRLTVEGARVRVLEQAPAAAGQQRWRVLTYTLEPAQDFALTDAAPHERTATYGHHIAPVQLTPTGAPAFAGGQWSYTQSTVVPRPLYVTEAHLPDQDPVHRRSNVFRPRCLFVDVDHDGDRDLLVEHTRLFDGGTRETVARLLGRAAIDHEVRMYPFEDGRFAETPAWQVLRTVRLLHPPRVAGPHFELYRAGELFDVTGDFNGDGLNDLVVYEAPTRIAVYLAEAGGFAQEAAATATVPVSARYACTDVDGDGRADLVVRYVKLGGEETGSYTRVWFARGEQP